MCRAARRTEVTELFPLGARLGVGVLGSLKGGKGVRKGVKSFLLPGQEERPDQGVS